MNYLYSHVFLFNGGHRSSLGKNIYKKPYTVVISSVEYWQAVKNICKLWKKFSPYLRKT
jgi:hypothetical protein